VLHFRDSAEVLDFAVKHTIERYSREIKADFLRVRLLGVILAALSANTEQTVIILNTMEGNGHTPFFSLFFDEVKRMVSCFTEDHDKKLAVLGLLSFVDS
jgi:hypothetical protein